MSPVGVRRRVVRLALLDGFELTVDGRAVELSFGSQRLLAFLSLNEHPLQRSYVAGKLWSDTSDDRAAANLRSTLWRLRRSGGEVVHATGRRLRISPEVEVDLRQMVIGLRQLVAEDPLRRTEVADLPITAELLPDWYDDWVAVERERYRQFRLHALEDICEKLIKLRRFADAAQVALAAIAAEPLRDRGHQLLISVYLAEQNPSEAIRSYRAYRHLLWSELRIDPPLETERMISAFCADANSFGHPGSAIRGRVLAPR